MWLPAEVQGCRVGRRRPAASRSLGIGQQQLRSRLDHVVSDGRGLHAPGPRRRLASAAVSAADSLPRSRGADRWSTLAADRRVLAIAHNVTAATRLFDVLPVLARDDRVEIVFTSTGSSAFNEGTEDFLAARGVRWIPWNQAINASFDMAISASYGGDLYRLQCPLVVIPHGMGYNKLLSREPGAGSREPGAGSREPGAGLRAGSRLVDARRPGGPVGRRSLPPRAVCPAAARLP